MSAGPRRSNTLPPSHRPKKSVANPISTATTGAMPSQNAFTVSPSTRKITTGDARIRMAKKLSDWTTAADAPEVCGWVKALSPGLVAGYGNRADEMLDNPRPMTRFAPLSAATDGSTAQSPKTIVVAIEPTISTGMPTTTAGNIRPARSASPRVPETKCSQMAVLSYARSLWMLQPRNRHTSGSGTRAMKCDGSPASASATITKMGMTGTRTMDTQ